MNPAFSVIFFTSSSGAGYGLLVFAGLLTAMGAFPEGSHVIVCAVGLAMILITVGLLSSTAHLGRPERAWRALSQWRSSWLSREGVLAIVTFLPTGLFFLGQFSLEQPLLRWLGWGPITAIMALLTVYSTGQIYASLKTIRQWCTIHVVPGYILIGLLGGGLVMSFIGSIFALPTDEVYWAIVLLAIVTGILKWDYWRNIDSGTASTTTNTATGLGTQNDRIRLLDAPTTSQNFVMREMGFRIARRHARKLRQISITTLFLIPTLGALCAPLIDSQISMIAITTMSLVSGSVGTVVERWLFFAEAKHVVTLYYGSEAA